MPGLEVFGLLLDLRRRHRFDHGFLSEDRVGRLSDLAAVCGGFSASAFLHWVPGLDSECF